MSAGNTGATTGHSGDVAVLFAVVVLTSEVPASAVLIFPTASAADTWAQDAGLDGYRVVPARFVNSRAPAVL